MLTAESRLLWRPWAKEKFAACAVFSFLNRDSENRGLIGGGRSLMRIALCGIPVPHQGIFFE
jgi:hypothetical protein